MHKLKFSISEFSSMFTISFDIHKLLDQFSMKKKPYLEIEYYDDSFHLLCSSSNKLRGEACNWSNKVNPITRFLNYSEISHVFPRVHVIWNLKKNIRKSRFKRVIFIKMGCVLWHKSRRLVYGERGTKCRALNRNTVPWSNLISGPNVIIDIVLFVEVDFSNTKDNAAELGDFFIGDGVTKRGREASDCTSSYGGHHSVVAFRWIYKLLSLIGAHEVACDNKQIVV